MHTENMSYEGLLVEHIHSAETSVETVCYSSRAKNMVPTDDEATAIAYNK